MLNDEKAIIKLVNKSQMATRTIRIPVSPKNFQRFAYALLTPIFSGAVVLDNLVCPSRALTAVPERAVLVILVDEADGGLNVDRPDTCLLMYVCNEYQAAIERTHSTTLSQLLVPRYQRYTRHLTFPAHLQYTVQYCSTVYLSYL